MEEQALTFIEIVVRLGIVLLLVLANGFFVASEFALVAARRTRIDRLAAEGSRSARIAKHAIGHLDHYLSATQLGITLASIGLGFVGEQTLAVILIQSFEGLPDPWNVVAAHGVAVVISFILITILHIVLGELAPKSLAILKPEKVSLWTAPPLVFFSKVLAPFIWVLNGLANRLLRLLGMEAPTEAEHVHRPEELEILVAQSHEHGLLAGEPVEMIRGVFDLSETTAEQVMTPRTEVVALPMDATVEEAAALILDEGHSRIPVYDGSLDHVEGVVLARDVWRAQREDGVALADLVRAVPFVPDSRPIEGLLREMQEERIHMVIVVDEFGGTAGVVTIEDLVEEIVGEIQDEHEEAEAPIERAPSGEILLDGTVPVEDINERFELTLPEEEYTTIAGYVMGRLGRIPRVGDRVAFGAGRFRVITMEGRRTKRLALALVPKSRRESE